LHEWRQRPRALRHADGDGERLTSVLNVWNFGKGGPGSVAMTKTKLRVFVSISTFDGEGVENTVDHGSELFYRITLFVSI
jgi:hypothetical protein